MNELRVWYLWPLGASTTLPTAGAAARPASLPARIAQHSVHNDRGASSGLGVPSIKKGAPAPAHSKYNQPSVWPIRLPVASLGVFRRSLPSSAFIPAKAVRSVYRW